jgi:hypothetical protein
MRQRKSAGFGLRSGNSPRSQPSEAHEWYSGTSPDANEEDDVKIGIVLAIAGLGLLAGCGPEGNKATGVPVTPKWKGSPYRLAFDTQAAKPNPAGVTIPVIKFTADPESVEKRAVLVVHFETPGSKGSDPVVNQMVMAPVDISGTEGALPADYMDLADKDLASFLGAYCIKGKTKISVALVRSSLTSLHPSDAELDAKRLSDWLPVEVVFKNPHPRC